ncbi:hypothetical protein CAOG_02441 [Capsaspora owczarzaki ATCC 30864]|uniref:BAH domain-containing protein n=1 Tax=Capsaspora owczarzaki (strain ATCC 30864) TaxID=595528 RepID=A0A0D2VMA6_CAPO3|nr:hypothetical protein CAOG_02441 [Capsaspora owczarzaki ATCC 30864]KJE91282.1 hypothetical protein CAOG_002441 [Capsaspora owczarzaki ATCC 30864]|eukprot:XP_004349191.1 hypothetical protein CAOG_02441 [Capsaspora owczarzaki ATCC 30864]
MSQDEEAADELKHYSRFVLPTREVFALHDRVYIKPPSAGGHEGPFIAQIVDIFSASEPGSEIWIRVKWYYQAADTKARDLPWIGESELFVTDHFDVCPAYRVIGQVIVIDGVDQFQNYQVNCVRHRLRKSLPEEELFAPVDISNVYYCRTTYDHRKGTVDTSALSLLCCDEPHNPDLLYIECDECRFWYHAKCVGIDSNEPLPDSYTCPNCSSKSSTIMIQ